MPGAPPESSDVLELCPAEFEENTMKYLFSFSLATLLVAPIFAADAPRA